MSNAERLAAYIRRHSIEARVLPDGTLQGESIWTLPDGGQSSEWETLEPTWNAVREWLGY